MKIKKLIMFFIIFLELLYLAHADNWVCYDSTGKVTEAELRAKFQEIGVQPNSPLQIIDTTQKTVTYTISSYFRDCGDSTSFTYCPENDYYLKSIFDSAQRCAKFEGAHHIYIGSNNLIDGVDCGLGGGPYCAEFYTVGDTSTPAEQSFVCGKDDNDWQTMTASSNWICPTCKELAVRYGDTPPYMGNITTFRDLSFPSGIKFSNSTIDLSFMVYILACINRVPMLNLKVDLIDPENNEIKNTEYGIYAKHMTIDYNAENLGMLRDYHLPNQEEYKKTYILKANLSGYRAWAWRERLVDAITRVVNDKDLEVPGYPYNTTQQKFGNLYYSDDFLLNLDKINNVSLTSTATVNKTQSGSINVLKNIDYVDGHEMCTVSDLEDYVNQYGLTTDLLNQLGKVIPLNNGTYLDIYNIQPGNNEVVNLKYNDLSITIDNETLFNQTIDELNNGLDGDLDLLNSLNILTYSKIDSDARNVVSGWFDYSSDIGCDSYNYKIGDVYLTNLDYTVTNNTEEVYDNETNTTETITVSHTITFNNVDIDATWINDIIANLELKYETNISTEYSWNFATLGELDPLNLAKCLYHFKECILGKVSDGTNTFYEVADCGMGPPSALAEPSIKDGARGSKTINQTIVVYRKCSGNDSWISKYGVYSCFNNTYYKCNFAVDGNDVIIGVKQAYYGDVINKGNGEAYVCTAPGIWKEINCNIN
jgi:hypothetical protein